MDGYREITLRHMENGCSEEKFRQVYFLQEEKMKVNREYQKTASEMMEDIRDKMIIDLRKQEDYQKGSCENAINIYWEEFDKRIGELPKNQVLYLLCYTGETSDEYAQYLETQGYEAYSIVEGYRGYLRWKLMQV